MLKDGFKASYTTIPFAVYKKRPEPGEGAFVAHHHKEVEIIAMTSGSAEFTVDSVPHVLRAGDIIFITPYSVHRGKTDSEAAYDCVCFDLSMIWDQKLARELEKGTLTVSGPIGADGGSVELCNHVSRAMDAYLEKKNGWEMEVIGRMSLVVSSLVRNGSFVKREGEQRENIFCKNVIDYVVAHYKEPITSASAAAALYLNNSYFCRLFKKHFNCNFSNFVNEYRVERAKVLLYNPESSVSDVAITTGFNSFSYFCKIFKSLVGVSPSDFRKKIL